MVAGSSFSSAQAWMHVPSVSRTCPNWMFSRSISRRFSMSRRKLLKEAPVPALTVQSRTVSATDFSKGDPRQWSKDLEANGFRKDVPTVWLVEGLLMYLTIEEQRILLQEIGRLSAQKSAAFMDAISESYVHARIAVAGAPFVGGSDDYADFWAREAGFGKTFVHDFQRSVYVDRANRRLVVYREEATPRVCNRRERVLFVETEKQ